jgi:DNA polymerase III sliding clamp (beta) subunit (PCNA family)
MMRFNTKELIEALTIMSKMERGAYYRSNLVFLRTHNGITEVLGTNGFVEVITEFHTGGSDDKIAVDRKTLLEAIKQEEKKNEVVTIYREDDHNIRIGGFKLRVEPIDVDRFTPEHVAMQKVSVRELIEAFSHVVYVAKETYSTKDVVFILNGKVFYASDNYRLARYEIKGRYDFPEEICVSGSAARLLVEAVRILKETVGEIGITDEMIVVRLGRYTIGMKKEQCALPAYESVLAQEHRTIVYVKAKEMIDALKQIKKIDKVKFVHIEIDPDNTKTIRLFSRDIDGNIGSLINVPVIFDNRENEKVDKAFNIQYLIDALNPVEKEQVALCDPGEEDGWIDIIHGKYRAMIMAAVLM